MAKITHPKSNEVIEGTQLGYGDVLSENDVYDSSSGKWEKCPCPGLVLQNGTAAIWVRPTRPT